MAAVNKDKSLRAQKTDSELSSPAALKRGLYLVSSHSHYFPSKEAGLLSSQHFKKFHDTIGIIFGRFFDRAKAGQTKNIYDNIPHQR